ncbi:MAG: hypothetical protein WCC60_04745 [Ilumatobacteraceae bacterium]
MRPLYRALPFITALLLAACTDDSGGASSTSPASSGDAVAPATQGESNDNAAPLCQLASAADLAALFPGATAGTPDPSSNSCTIGMTTAGGTAYFMMTPSLAVFDDRTQQDTDLGFTLSQLDGIGDRAYYSRGNDTFPQSDLVFEKAGTTYAVRASYANSGQAMVAEPTLQDTLMRIASAWAASI